MYMKAPTHSWKINDKIIKNMKKSQKIQTCIA